MTRFHERALPHGVRVAQLLAAGIAISAVFNVKPAKAQPVEFQSGFMRQSGEHSDQASVLALKALARKNTLAPGRYWVTIQVNQNHFGQREIEFTSSAEDEQLLACLSAALLKEMGVRADNFSPEQQTKTCIDLPGLTLGASSEFDSSTLRLAISIPQAAMRRDVIGHVPADQWQSGINAAFVNYQLSAQQGNSRYTGNRESHDINLNSGFNIGAWRFRSNQSLRQNEEGRREWMRAYTYIQRDIPGTHANLTLGETFTPGDVFRSVPINGLTINSDMGMLPDVLQGYAPIIRGVAQTRAKLEVLQNGYPIYTTYVSPGPYEIDDLSTAGGSGELEVVLSEEDGQVFRYTQPYASINNLLRQGVWRYSATVARYNAAYDTDHPLLWQGTLALGTAWNSTLYGGVLGSEFYQAGTLGLSKDFASIGALAFDVTHSTADIDTAGTQHVQGMSYAIKYGKSFQTRTNLRFAGYRFSTQGYRDFDEAQRQRNQATNFYGSRRSRLEASLYQNLGKQSSLGLTFSHQDYWYTAYKQRQFQVQFNTQYKGISYNLFASQALNDSRGMSATRQIGLSMSIPLDWAGSSTATFDVQKYADRVSERASLGGSLDQNRLSYRVSASHDNNQQTAATVALGYQAPFGSVGAGLTQGRDYRNLSVNASGAVLLHGEGVELGPYLGETMGLVEVPNIPDVGVHNTTGVRTNQRGFALIPYLRPYRVNDVQLQLDDLAPDVEIENGASQMIPTRGAIVKTTFAARKVNRMVLTGHTVSGQPLPFGAQVNDAAGHNVGMVGQAGQVMLTTGTEEQTLEVRWGDGVEQRCDLHINPSQMQQSSGYYLQTLSCR